MRCPLLRVKRTYDGSPHCARPYTDNNLGEGIAPANTCKDGLLGNVYRAKYRTTGTHAGNTNVRIDLMTDGLTASP
jgi:hypothetical protein